MAIIAGTTNVGRRDETTTGTNALSGGSALDRLMASGDMLARFGAGGALHVVKAGETLSGIARDAGTSWQTLARINGIADPDRIRVGQQIRLPVGRDVHIVRPGETLSGIAAATGTSVAALARSNGIADPDLIRPGQRFVVTRGAADAATTTSARRTTTIAPRNRSASTTSTAPAQSTQGTTPTPGSASLRAADLAAQRAAGRHSGGQCYAWVKTALQRSGAVSDYMPGVAAKDAGPALERRGFVNLLSRPGSNIRSPYDAPKGAVLVYVAAPGATDRNARYGHIEIRTATGFASDYASANARTGGAANGLSGRGRTLIGVYVKPDTVSQATQPTRTTSAAAPQSTAVATTDRAYAPDNLSLGANERYRADILEASTRTGMAPQTVAAIIDAETLKGRDGVWQTNAKAGTSSATGMTQFLSSTWLGEATRAGGVLNQEAKARGLVDGDNHIVDRAGLLAARNDPRLSILAGADYARGNLAALRQGGDVPADAFPAALAKYAYVAHHEGLAGARGFLRGDMSYLRPGTFEANVPESRRTAYLQAAGGSVPAAYRNWLADYADSRINVTRFMHDANGVVVPPTRSLYR